MFSFIDNISNMNNFSIVYGNINNCFPPLNYSLGSEINSDGKGNLMELVSALLGAIAGGLIATATAYFVYLIQHRSQVTQKYIDEFLSEAMLKHIIVVGNLREKLANPAAIVTGADDPFSIARLARGYWKAAPGVPYDYYKGPVSSINGLNEHQSLEVILRYIGRLQMNIERKYINIDDLREAIQGSYIWLDDVLRPLEMEVKRQVAEHVAAGGVVEAIGRITKLHQLREALEIDRPNRMK